eukprot:11904395-Prorocentrum_lima.AAC.1
MIESWRPEHALNFSEKVLDEEGRMPVLGDSGKRLCPWCELDCRWEEWPEFSEKERKEHPNYCLLEQ